MSSVSRPGPRGGKGAAKNAESSATGSKPQKTEPKADVPKGTEPNPKTQPTAEQMRMAQYFDNRTEDPDLKNKIKQVMDATRKSEDEVCTALHDCDNDLDRAVNMLLEGDGQDEWVTSGKKKKNRNPGTAVSSSRGEKPDGVRDRSEPGESGPDRERSRTRGGGPPRMRGRGSSDSRGWRGRENKENEKNLQEDGGREGLPRRGGGRMANGPGRSGRGGRGGRSGPRTFQSRGEKTGPGFPRSIDTWNPHGEADPAEAPTNGPDAGAENWDDNFPSPEDWDNEEYTGSLADTKVFTSSVSTPPGTGASGGAANAGKEGVNADLAAAAASLPGMPAQPSSLETAASMLPAVSIPVSQGGQPLTAAQSKYLSQLSQGTLATENLKAAVGVGGASLTTNGTKEPVSYVSAVNSGGYQASAAGNYANSSPASAYTATTVSYAASTYGSVMQSSAPSYSSQAKGPGTMGHAPSQQQLQQSQGVQGSQGQTHQQQSAQQQAAQSRPKPQRPRVPPPSKIPQSAVEMPGDSDNNIGYLDVQFGALDFTSDSNTFDFTSPSTLSEPNNKYQSPVAGSGVDNSSGMGGALDSSKGQVQQTQQSTAQTQSVQQQGNMQQQQSVQQVPVQQQVSQQVAAHQQASVPVSGLDGYSTSGSGQQPSSVTSGQSMSSQHSQHMQHTKDLNQQSLSAAMAHSQKLSGDSMTFPSQVSEHKAQQSSASTNYSQSRTGGGSTNTSSTGLDLSKSEASSNSSLSYSNQSNNQSSNASYHSSYQKPPSVYQSSANYSSSGGGGGGGGSAYTQGSNSAANQYQTSQQGQTSGYTSSQTGYNSQSTAFPSSAAQPASTSYSQTSGSSGYHQAQSNSYQGSSYPSSMSQPSSASVPYQSTQQYQTASQQQQQQAYSGSGGSTGYTPAASSSVSSQYQNSYGSNGPVTAATSLHGTSSTGTKLGSGMGSSAGKDSQYEVPNTAVSSSLGTVQGGSSATPSSLGLISSAGQATNTASTKVSSSTAGVPPTMLGQHQYIMGQGGMPYFNVQQPIYGFDDYHNQIMQSRGVPMQTSGFYDLSSLTPGRESGMTSVAYSVSDGRFARADNNSSPVPSTLSQQNPTPTHQQPMLNPTTLPPGYAYFYGAGVMPAGSFQYGTPALYQLPTATNAHGATNSTQYAKPASYSSGYSTGYDSLTGQGAADYSKTSGYVSGGSQAGQGSKGSVVGSSGSSTGTATSASDLTSNMYGKAHVALGKVNSYDKQGFHSGTPPPFNLPGAQTSQMGAATAGYTPLFIPTLAAHQQLHQPLHQMEFRNQGRRSDSGSGSGQRSQPSSQQSKSGVKSQYNASYWGTQN